MIDNCGRTIDYIRISITDRCNLRCVYCMPEEGVPSLAHQQILTFDEIVRLCRVLATQGLKKVKITGGEPLVRKGAVNLIRAIKSIEEIESVTLTTNGVLLSEYYEDLVQAGIDCITVSLDTLHPQRYQAITRRDQLQQVLAGITLAQQKNKVDFKLNVVPMKDTTPQEILAIAQFAQQYATHVRFIEMMPIGEASQEQGMSEEQIRHLLTQHFGDMTPCNTVRGNGPAQYYTLENFKGKIGFISAVSHQFCHQCNRVRLTADGVLKTCLQYQGGVSLLDLMRQGCDDATLLKVVANEVHKKPKQHHFDQQQEFSEKEQRRMSQIGG